MEYLWHNSTNEHKITYSCKGRFCFFLFFASPVATFFHYFAQNVRVTPNLRKKGGERRRASKKQFYYSKTPCEKKVPRRRAISSKYFSPLKFEMIPRPCIISPIDCTIMRISVYIIANQNIRIHKPSPPRIIIAKQGMGRVDNSMHRKSRRLLKNIVILPVENSSHHTDNAKNAERRKLLARRAREC